MISIQSTQKSPQLLSVKFQNSEEGYSTENSDYFVPWLRENCRCPKCYLYSSNQRVYVLGKEELDSLDTELVEIVHLEQSSTKNSEEIKNSGSEEQPSKNLSSSQLKVQFNDGHISVFDSHWLWQRGWDPKTSSTRYEHQEKKKLQKITWTKEEIESKGGIDVYDFEKVMNDEEELFKWCKSLIKYGLVLTKNVPKEEGQVRELAKKISFLELSNYGETFKVAAKKNPSNLAYTDIPLLCHNDLPFLETSPGVQLLHCIKQASEGGSNPFCDAFRIANDLKENEETLKYYETLSKVHLSYWNCANDYIGDFHYRSKHTLIEHDPNGEIDCINFNHVVRDSIFNLPANQMKEYYEAYRYFLDQTNSTKYQIRYRMEDGEMVAFHNRRVLHGREKFSSPNANDSEIIRHLEGAYIRFQDVLSRYRVLGKKFGEY